VNVPLVDVFTPPKSKTAIAALTLLALLALYITAACAEIVAEVKLKFAKSTKAVDAVALVFVKPTVALAKVPPPAAYVPESGTSLVTEYAAVFASKAANL